MTVKLSSLRVAADMDSSKYVAGMKAKVAADQAGAASSEQVGDSVKRTQTKVNSAGDIWTRLSRQYVEGAGSAQKMQAALRSLQRGLDTGNVSMEQAETILTGLNAKLGLMANAEELAANGQNQLAAAVARVNARLAEQPPVLDKVNKSGAMSRQLMFQLVDIGQAIPLAFQSPTYALQNFGFQIAQIGQLYAGNGGMKAALTDAIGMVGRFAGALLPIAAIVGGVALAVAGLTSELDRDTGKNITFMETLKAVGQALWANLTGLVGPAIKQVGTWFGDFVAFVAPALKTAGNAIINTFVVAFNDIKDTWSQLPAALGDLVIQAANNVISGVHDMVSKSLLQIVDFIGKLGPALSVIPGGSALQSIALSAAGGLAKMKPLENRFAGAAAGVGNTFAKNAAAGYAQDPLGNFYGQVKDFALQNFAADAGKANDAVKKLAKDGLGKLTEAQRAAAQELDFYRGTFSSFFTDLMGGFKQGEGAVEAFGDAFSNALSSIGNHLLQLGANTLFNNLFGGGSGLLGGLFGGGSSAPFSIAGMPMYASGTSFAPGGLALVGERGPELVNLPRGSQVMPAGQTAAALGGNTINISITGSRQDAAEIARVVSNTLDKQFPTRAAAYNRNNLRRS